ncbi:MAG TPA: phosphopantothenoylcysteine decarboxylase, partial [Phenylobacterium sp.]|nr:phosphopantothenoylcysteine decarboxylase [Phenylobacterium sp.]
RSSGRQGHAIAAALARLGAEVTLVTGPVALPDPPLVTVRHVESARQMLAAVEAHLPADIAVCAAAVADWRPAQEGAVKIKKGTDGPPPIALVENPDILATLSAPGPGRPRLVVGFAAETNDVEAYAQAKLKRKGCDWIVANDVSIEGTMGGDDNAVSIVTGQGVERWDRTAKSEVAARLAARMAQELSCPPRPSRSPAWRTMPTCRCRPMRRPWRRAWIRAPPCPPRRRWCCGPWSGP